MGRVIVGRVIVGRVNGNPFIYVSASNLESEIQLNLVLLSYISVQISYNFGSSRSHH